MELDGISHRDRQAARRSLEQPVVTCGERYAIAAIPSVGCAAAAISGDAMSAAA
jgi:hypothetical protein